MRASRLVLSLAAAASLTVALSSCSSGGDPLAAGSSSAKAGAKEAITIGSANFPESALLATIYEKALQAKGVTVTTKLSIGSRETYFPALKDGSIDLLPEYSGATLSYLDPKTDAHSSQEVIAGLDAALPDGIKALTASDAQDSDVLAVLQTTADKDSLTSIGDLKAKAATMVLGGPPEWKTRREGVAGLKEVYGLQFSSFKTLDVAGPLTVAALVNGQVAAADMTSTDPALAAKHLVALQDPSHLFPAQNILPLIAKDKVTPTITSALQAVSKALTTKDLIAMNGDLAAHKTIDDVAAAWVKDHDLS